MNKIDHEQMTMHPYHTEGDFDRMMVLPAFAGGILILLGIVQMVYVYFTKWHLDSLGLKMVGIGGLILIIGLFIIWLTKPEKWDER